jgi:hypothetical protein
MIDSELHLERKKDVFNAYRQVCSDYPVEGRYLSRKFLVQKAMSLPAPRFYLTYQRARQIISYIYAEDFYKLPSTPRRFRMYADLFAAFTAAGGTPDNFDPLHTVLESPAPSFYLDYDYFYALIRAALKTA